MNMKHALYKYIVSVVLIVIAFLFVISAGKRKDFTNVYSCKENQDMKIAITFDDGPHVTQTEEILNILEKYNVPATFFVIGEYAEKYPDIINKQLAAGHELGNHTFSHISINCDNLKAMEDEITKTEKILFENNEYRAKLFRPPEGICNSQIASIAASLDYSVILWNIDTRDWAHTSKEYIVNMVMRNIDPGDIVLFHDGVVGESHTAEALDEIIPLLKEKGYNFVTVSELLISK